MKAITLDVIDRQILTQLQQDGRMSVAQLATAVGLTATPLRQRIDKLERHGVIRGYRADVDPAAVGRRTMAFVHVMLKDHTAERHRAFIDWMSGVPEVSEVHHISGEFDFLLKVLVADIADFESFRLQRLAAFDGIDRAKTTFVLSSSKQGVCVPIDNQNKQVSR